MADMRYPIPDEHRVMPDFTLRGVDPSTPAIGYRLSAIEHRPPNTD
jgi:hypothetical protein